MPDVYQFLNSNQISYAKYDHEAVFSAEEAKTKAGHVPGQQTKNLFLCDDKKQRFYLITIPDEKRADLKHLKTFLNEKSLRFAPADKMQGLLGLLPGSVSPLGLINDVKNVVKFYIDPNLLKEKYIYIHPNINTATVEIAVEDFKKILNLTEHHLNFYQLPNE